MLEYKSKEIEEFRQNKLPLYQKIKGIDKLPGTKKRESLLKEIANLPYEEKKIKKYHINAKNPPLNMVKEMLKNGKEKICKCGYKYIEYKEYRAYLHRLVCMDYYGKIPKGLTIHHKDKNKLNNNINNLELLTWKEHMRKHH